MLNQHKLARVFFSMIVSILLILFIVIYWYSVPLIKKEIYEIERNSSRLALNNVFELANKMHFNVEAYREEAIGAHKRNLVSVVTLAEAYVRNTLDRAERHSLTQEQALSEAFEGLRAFTYGNEDYIWVADNHSKILSHPDPRFHGSDASFLKDSNGQLIIPNVIDSVMEKGEGFYQYTWHRLSKQESVDKISYVKYIPEWNVFIGTGVYLDDIDEEVTLRKAQAIKEVRQALREITIAKTGYLFIFDKQGNMLVHPNPNIDETNALTLKDPVTQQSILKELINVADTGNELFYKWDRPTDPNNYVYDKLSLVRYLEGFDWYICSSVYVEELQASAELLGARILTIGLIALFIAIVLAFLFVQWITRPITTLASVAEKVSRGDLSVRSGIVRADELGVLAMAFDSMVGRLRENIETLDTKVADRTKALAKTNTQLQEAQRMSAVGQLAGGLAHDFNNILTIILGNLLAAKDRFSDNKALLNRLTPAINASKRGSNITNRLLAFARRQSLMPCRVDLEALIEETVVLLEGSLPSNISVTYDISTNKFSPYVDPGQLENCLINLVLNSKDAMLTGGSILLKVTEQNVISGVIYDEEVAPGQYILIEVLDNGSGFSDEAMTLAFEPFFTTKSKGEGAGLGLSMVYGFIKQSKGYITLENRDTGGAKISILLPAKQREIVVAIENTPLEASSRNHLMNKVVLLVEDDTDVRNVVREQLVSFGFSVIEACDADEAEMLIQTLDNLYGMVTDISMPGGKNGFDLAKLFRQATPKSRIVLMSGYAYDDAAEGAHSYSFPVLRKPFESDALLKALTDSGNYY